MSTVNTVLIDKEIALLKAEISLLSVRLSSLIIERKWPELCETVMRIQLLEAELRGFLKGVGVVDD